MTIEIVAVGDELLNGITVNTNATFISRKLSESGYAVGRHTVLPDRSPALEEGLREALSRSALVITTGGLGPTCDDVTRDAAAKIFSSSFHTDAELEKELFTRFGGKLKSLADQARVPSKALLLKNRIGTASGLLFSEGGKTLVLMPGVPQEMRPMLENELLPLLPNYYAKGEATISQMVHFGLLFEDHVDPTLRELQVRFPQMEFGIYPAYGFLSVRLTSKDVNAIRACKEELERIFSQYLFEDTEGKIERAVHTLFTKNGWTLACAESCTGGQIAAKLTSIPGASNFFLASLVTYANAMKEEFLGVKSDTLRVHGSVSQEAAREMAEGTLQRSGADVAIAISGIAGPDGGTAEKPVGTVWVAVARKKEDTQ